MSSECDYIAPCETCEGTGIVYPPALFGQPVPEDAAEDCRDCLGTGHDQACRGGDDAALYEQSWERDGRAPMRRA